MTLIFNYLCYIFPDVWIFFFAKSLFFEIICVIHEHLLLTRKTILIQRRITNIQINTIIMPVFINSVCRTMQTVKGHSPLQPLYRLPLQEQYSCSSSWSSW